MDEKSKVFSVAEIARMLSPLFKEEELQLVLLFGSISSGVFHPQSDIDLAFLYEKPVDILDLTNKVIRLLHSDLVDIVDLRRASPSWPSPLLNKAEFFMRSPRAYSTFFIPSLSEDMWIRRSCGKPRPGPSSPFWKQGD